MTLTFVPSSKETDNAALADQSIGGLRSIFDAARAIAESVMHVQNQPRCDYPADEFLQEFINKADALAEAVATEIETRIPEDKWEASQRLQVLMEFALSVEFTPEGLARIALTPPPAAQEAA